MPSRFETEELTIGSRALGEICYSRLRMPNGTVCNPAFLAQPTESSLLGFVFFGNGYAALSTANQFIFQPITSQFLQTLFQQQNVTSLDANAALVFTTRYFSAEFLPYRVQFVSEVQNPNFPVIDIHAAIEKSLVFSGGIPGEVISPNLREWSAGLRVSLIQRDYVNGSFSLFDAISTDPRVLLPAVSQQAVLFAPTVAWVPAAAPWHLHASVGAENLGRDFPQDPAFPDTADLVAGIGVEPPVPLGTLSIGLDLVQLINGPDFLSRFRLGASYKLGILEMMAGANENAVTAGLQFSFQVIQVGIVYEFMRSDFSADTPDTRISTELGIRL